MRTTYPLFIVLSLFAALVASPAAAKENPLDFLHLMQDDYPDIAVDYLDQLKADPDNAPKEIMDLWDLEMSRSKKKAAAFAYTPAQAQQLTETSKALLEKFIKANPDRPEAIQEAAAGRNSKLWRASIRSCVPPMCRTRPRRPNSWPMPARSSKIYARSLRRHGRLRSTC